MTPGTHSEIIYKHLGTWVVMTIHLVVSYTATSNHERFSVLSNDKWTNRLMEGMSKQCL